VHDHSTRAAHNRRQNSAKPAAVLVAVLLLIAAVTAMAPRLAQSAATAGVELSSAPPTATIDSNVAHDIAIEIVAPGREGLELSARLTDEGGLIERPITWKISTAAGEAVYSADSAIADLSVAPGDYLVELRYGAVHFARTISLLEGNHLMVSFVLNAGGIRILPRLRGGALPAAPSRSLIYALSGPHAGELVTESSLPGEIVRVPSGDYRVESRFSGNAVAVADVHVKPGIMSAVEIDHVAGLARLAFVGAPDAEVSWRITDATGLEIPAIDGLAATVVLKPGAYTAQADVGGETLSASFVIDAGEERDILLGN